MQNGKRWKIEGLSGGNAFRFIVSKNIPGRSIYVESDVPQKSLESRAAEGQVIEQTTLTTPKDILKLASTSVQENPRELEGAGEEL